MLEGKMPPHDSEIERAVLGALMLEYDKFTLIGDFVNKDFFYLPAHQLLFEAIKTIYKNGQRVDILTVNNHLRKHGKLEDAGGSIYLAQLTHKVSSGANIEFHCRLLQQHYIGRKAIELGFRLQNDAFTAKDPIENVLSIISDLSDLLEFKGKSALKLSKVVANALKQVENEQTNPSQKSLILSGFTELDQLCGGFKGGDLVVVGGRPGMGKTAFAMSLLKNNAVAKRACLMFSLEMNASSLAFRVLTSEAKVSNRNLRMAEVNEQEWKRIWENMPEIDRQELFIDDSPLINLYELQAKARREHGKHGIKLIVIDYLQLITVERGKGIGNREQEIALISRTLKALAKELNVPIIALAQLSRGVEARPNKRPMNSDLRESGAIEQDADLIVFTYRDSYYNKEADENEAEIIVTKNRNGSTGKVLLKFNPVLMKFSDRIEAQQRWDNSDLKPREDINY